MAERAVAAGLVALLAALPAARGAAEAGGALPANVATFLRCVPPGHWPREAKARDLEYLFAKFAVTEADLLPLLDEKSEAGDLAWRALLSIASPEAAERLAANLMAGRRVPGGPSHVVHNVRSDHLESEALTRALAHRMPLATPKPDERCEAALSLMALAPVAEATPVFRNYLLQARSVAAVQGLGRARRPDALKTLEGFWAENPRNAEPDFRPFDRELARAIGSYGGAGVAVLRRLFERNDRPPDFLYEGLELAATPEAVAVVEDFGDPADEADRISLFRVKAAAGEPFRSEALLAALSDVSDRVVRAALEWLRTARGERLAGLDPEVALALRRLALSHDARYQWQAIAALERLSAPKAAEPEPGAYVWGEPVNGLTLGIRDPRFYGHAIQCDVAVANATGRTIRLWLNLSKLTLELPPTSPFLADSYTYARTTTRLHLAPRETARIGGGFWVKVVRQDHPLRSALAVELAVADDPELKPEWTGQVRSGWAHLEAVPRQEEGDLEPWRAFLAETIAAGELPEGSSIHWGRHPGGPVASGEGTRFHYGNRITSTGLWVALPADLRVLSPEEVRKVCQYLLAEDRFAKATVRHEEPMGKYPPGAAVTFVSSTRWASWSGYHFTKPFEEGWRALMASLLEPRLSEARRRLGIQGEF